MTPFSSASTEALQPIQCIPKSLNTTIVSPGSGFGWEAEGFLLKRPIIPPHKVKYEDVSTWPAVEGSSSFILTTPELKAAFIHQVSPAF